MQNVNAQGGGYGDALHASLEFSSNSVLLLERGAKVTAAHLATAEKSHDNGLARFWSHTQRDSR